MKTLGLHHGALGDSTEFGFLDRSVHADQEFLNPTLISNDDKNTMLGAIRAELRHCRHFTFSVAFITSSALAMLKQELVSYRGSAEIITSSYLGFNEPAMFEELLALKNVTTRIHQSDRSGFHAKGYIFEHDSYVTAIVGSSNLTDTALSVNHEWNLKFSASNEGHIVHDLQRAVFRQRAESISLTSEWISEYERTRVVRPVVVLPEADNAIEFGSRIEPNSMQIQALERLEELRDTGERRAVIISATGTGKTILAALAVRAAQPKRMLFVVHREQILDKAIHEFQRVLDHSPLDYGRLVGGVDQADRPYVFASVQTLSKPENLARFAPNTFDYIIIDEVHRSGSASYQRIVDHFDPDMLLGLTATPERTDGFNVFELFDFNVPYEIRLQAALEADMLVPFHYYGITDYVDDRGETIEETKDLRQLVFPERIKYIVQMLERYGHPRDVQGLMFCSSNLEARELSARLNEEMANGRRLRTVALSGTTSIDERERQVGELEAGRLDYILTVDIFNEGIDIPSVNQVVMLRNTESSIVFTQQLGRGLRKAKGKTHLRVIDFIGNYKNNYLIPIALWGENSRNRDRIRERIVDQHVDNTIAGISTVNFDEIAQERIFDSIQQSKLTSKAELKKEILLLKNRLNRIPRLMDFLMQDTTDPVVLANAQGNYWALLHGQKFVETEPSQTQGQFLNFISHELLPGKRPHELAIMKTLLDGIDIRKSAVDTHLAGHVLHWTDKILWSVERVLSMEFYTSQQERGFGKNPVVIVDGDHFEFGSEFVHELANEEFRSHVVDAVETGLEISRRTEGRAGDMTIGNLYSRRDVCRILGFGSNQESTVYGYKVDETSKTCPIFVTYHKDEGISASTKYKDAFIDRGAFHWYTRSRKTLESREVQQVMSGEYDLHLFIKKDDAEGNDFYYLGPVTPKNPEQQTMPGDDGKLLNVVTMTLSLETPVEPQLYAYLNTNLES